MKTIIAKFNSTCAASGLPIKKGETINYNPRTRKAYKLGHTPNELYNNDFVADPGEIDADNFCQRNNI